MEFTKIHVFPCSVRKGTKAEAMDGAVKESIKKERVHVLLDLSKELEIKYMKKFIGKKVKFIKEIEKNGFAIGHTDNFLLIETLEIEIKDIEYPYCID